jgi:hypothetical protein
MIAPFFFYQAELKNYLSIHPTEGPNFFPEINAIWFFSQDANSFSSSSLSESKPNDNLYSNQSAYANNESGISPNLIPVIDIHNQKIMRDEVIQNTLFIGLILALITILTIITIYLRLKSKKSSTPSSEKKALLENMIQHANILRYQEKFQEGGQKSVILKKFKAFKNELDQFTDSLKISIIIPLYNEEKSIKRVLERIPPRESYEIIIVNDGSTDKSIKKVSAIEDSRIILIHHEENEGYGSAVLSGLEEASGDIIVTLDSDGQHDPQEIPKLIAPILFNQADIVIGSRYLGNSTYKVPIYTRMGEFLISKILWLFFHQRVRNNQSGFRAFKRKHIALFKNMVFKGFAICTEALFKAALKNLRIKEVPINMRVRKFGCSYVKVARIVFSIASCIIIYSLKRLKIRKFIPNVFIDTVKRRLLDILN